MIYEHNSQAADFVRFPSREPIHRLQTAIFHYCLRREFCERKGRLSKKKLVVESGPEKVCDQCFREAIVQQSLRWLCVVNVTEDGWLFTFFVKFFLITSKFFGALK